MCLWCYEGIALLMSFFVFKLKEIILSFWRWELSKSEPNWMVPVQTTSPLTQRKGRILWFSGEKQDCKDKLLLLLTVSYVAHYNWWQISVFWHWWCFWGVLNGATGVCSGRGTSEIPATTGRLRPVRSCCTHGLVQAPLELCTKGNGMVRFCLFSSLCVCLWISAGA